MNTLILLALTTTCLAQVPQLVRDINAGAADSIKKDESAYPRESKFAAVGQRLFFACDDGSGVGEELCVSDGSVSGTRLVRDVNLGAASAFTRDNEQVAGVAVGDLYVFRAIVGGVDQLWVSGGCDKNTYNVRVINNGNANIRTFKTSPTIPGKAFFFASEVGPQEDELWVTDGTPEGTKTAVDACTEPGCGGAYGADDMGFIGSKVIFSASSKPRTGFDGMNQLWYYDANTGQGREFAVLRPAGGSPDGFARGFANISPNQLLFAANDGTAAVSRVWKTDGNSAQLVSAQVDGVIPPLIASNGKVFFQARDAAAGNELHVATATSVQLVKDLIVGNVHGHAEEITDMGSYVMYSGDKELYRSDGTAQGTSLVKDINANGMNGASPGQSYPRNFIRVGSMMVFSGDDGINGRELWISDGTTANTKMLADIAPGAAASSPQDFTLIGTTLFFSANDGTRGRELWKVEFGAPLQPPAPIICPATQIETPQFTDGIPGACCLSAGNCQSTTLSVCGSMNGNFLGINTNCASSGTMCNVAPPMGACCKGTQCLINQSPTSCGTAGGNFKAGVACSGSVCAGGMSVPTGERGACCKADTCLLGHTAASCGGVGGTFKGVGALCNTCFGGPPTPPSSAQGVCCKGSGGSRTCLLGHTASSCTGVGDFKTDCNACYADDNPTGTPANQGCDEDQNNFCSLACGGLEKVSECSCNGINTAVFCKPPTGGVTPTPNANPTPAPVPTPLPPGATSSPFPAPGPGTFTEVQVPVTDAVGNTVTAPGGAVLTKVIQPVTQVGGVVPTDANGNVVATKVINPVTDAAGNTVAGQTSINAPLPTPMLNSNNDGACSETQIQGCQTFCQKTGIAMCACTGTGINVKCREGTENSSASVISPTFVGLLAIHFACIV